MDIDEYKNKLEKDIPDVLKDFIEKHLSKRKLTMYTGVVEDNNDPDKLGRCRIRVYGIFDDKNITTSSLPWALPEQSFVGSNVGNFVVPPVDTLVRVYFDDDDIYKPVYTNKACNTQQLPEDRLENYPNNLIMFETDNNDTFAINTETFEVSFRTASGVSVIINSEGNITIDNTVGDTGNVTINVKGNVDLNSEEGDISVEANRGNVKLGNNDSMTQCPNANFCYVTGASLAVGKQFPGTPGSVKIPL